MRRLDTYVLSQLISAFLFFCLIMTGVIWLAKAVPLIDTVISSGKSILVFFQFSAYVLPQVLKIVMPLAALASAVYTLNKLYGEAELVVMMAVGQGPFALARPTLVFALIVAVLTWIATILLGPYSERKLSEQTAELRSELVGALIVEGRFLHPTKGLSIFLRDTSDDGQMAGLFLHDERDPNNPTTYTANRAVLLRDGDLARLVMTDGIALNYSASRNILSQVRFDEFSYDLSDLVARNSRSSRRASSYDLSELLNPSDEMLARKRYKLGNYLATGHERIVLGLNAFLMPLIALAMIISGSYQRQGFGKRISMAIGTGVGLSAFGVLANSVVSGNGNIWPIFYATPLLVSFMCFYLLRRASQPRKRMVIA